AGRDRSRAGPPGRRGDVRAAARQQRDRGLRYRAPRLTRHRPRRPMNDTAMNAATLLAPSPEAIKTLVAGDPIFARCLTVGGPLTARQRLAGFDALLRIILDQQVSTAAGAAMWRRLTEFIDPVTPHGLLALDDESLRACGFSRQKMTYGRALAEAIV